MKKIYYNVLFFAFVISAFSQDMDPQKIYDSLSEEKKIQWKQIEKRKDEFSAGVFTPITFYGKVIDQNGDPVPNTVISISAESFTPNPLLFYGTLKDSKLNVNANGEFCYNGRGRMILVYLWPPEGFEKIKVRQNNRFYYGQTPGENKKILHKPDKDNPVIFTLRKKEKAEILLVKNRFVDLSLDRAFDKPYYVDLFQEQQRFMVYAENNGWKQPPDYRPQISITQRILKDDENEQEKEVTVCFYGGIRFAIPDTNPFNEEIVMMDSRIQCDQKESTKIWIRQDKKNPFDFYLSRDGKEWKHIPSKDWMIVDRPGFWIEFPGNYYGRLMVGGLRIFPNSDKDVVNFGVSLELNTVPGNRIFEREDSRHLSAITSDDKLKKLENMILEKFYATMPPFSEILSEEKVE